MPPEPVFGVKKILHEQRFAPDRTVANWYSCPKKFFPVPTYRSMPFFLHFLLLVVAFLMSGAAVLAPASVSNPSTAENFLPMD